MCNASHVSPVFYLRVGVLPGQVDDKLGQGLVRQPQVRIQLRADLGHQRELLWGVWGLGWEGGWGGLGGVRITRVHTLRQAHSPTVPQGPSTTLSCYWPNSLADDAPTHPIPISIPELSAQHDTHPTTKRTCNCSRPPPPPPAPDRAISRAACGWLLAPGDRCLLRCVVGV